MLSKKCPRCQSVKRLIKFGKHKGRKNGYQVYCKKCNRELAQEKREKDPEFYLAYSRQYRTRRRLTPEGKYTLLKRNAKTRKIELAITSDEFRTWLSNQELYCYYCKQQIDPDTIHALNSFTLDRKDNSTGYSLENIVIACQRCNLIKGSWFTEETMLDIANKYLREAKAK